MLSPLFTRALVSFKTAKAGEFHFVILACDIMTAYYMTAPTGKVVVGGGSGFIGTQLCRLLQNKGYDYKIVSRMPGPKRMTWHELKEGGLPSGTTAVVNLAGQNVLDPTRRWTDGFKQNIWNSRIKTTTALAEAIVKAKITPSVFVSMSGVGIYEPKDNVTYSEDSRGEQFDFFSTLCHAWENAAKLSSDVNCRQVCIRSGVVLGRHGGMIKQLYWPFYFGLGGPIGTGEQVLPWIHVNDLSRLIFFAIENKELKGILNGVAPERITNKQFTQAFASAMWRPALIPIPKGVLNLIFNKERAKMMTKGQSVLPKRTQAVGFKYVFPDIRTACSELTNSAKPSPF